AVAEPLLQKALAIRLKVQGEDHPDTASSYNELALNLDDQDDLQDAVRSWTAAAEIAERTRLAHSGSGLERAAATEKLDARRLLGMALARQGRFGEGWTRWESSLARGILDDYSSRRLRPLNAEERQSESDLVGQLQQLDEQIGRLAAKSGRNQEEDQRL